MTITPDAPLDLVLEPLGGELITGGPTTPPPLGFILDVLGGALYATRAPGEAADALRVAIVDSTGTTLVPDVPRRTGLTGLVESNAPGSVTLTMGTDDFDGLDPDLLDPRNLMQVYYGDIAIAEATQDAAPPQQDDTGHWQQSITGRGSIGVLDNAVLYPEVWADNEDRQFDFSSRRTPYGGWYIPSEWFTPQSRKIRTSFRWTFKKRRQPKGWPEFQSRWLWSTNPELGSPDGPRWFRAEITLTATKHVRIWAAGDDAMLLKVDGNTVLYSGPGGWRKARSVTLVLEAGLHVIAAKVTNIPTGDPGQNRSGFLFAMGQLGSDGQVVSWLLRSTASNFVVSKGPTPGWFPPTVLLAHVNEAVLRGVDGYADLTMNFTSTHDSDGQPWVARRDMSIPIGSIGTDVAAQVVAEGYDVAMLPGLRLSVWRNRGRDLRSFVAIGVVESAGYASRVWSRVRSYVLTHASFGWRSYPTPKTGVTAAYGRREMMFSGGNAKSASATQTQSQNALRDVATPEETFDVGTRSTEGPQPFLDYDIEDIIMVATRQGYIPARVKSIAFTENTDKTISWTTTVYPFATPVAP